VLLLEVTHLLLGLRRQFNADRNDIILRHWCYWHGNLRHAAVVGAAVVEFYINLPGNGGC